MSQMVEHEPLIPLEARPTQAVAVILFSPEELIYTIVETESRPDYGKIAGMRTIPMETIDPGETCQTTFLKLLKEEVGEDIVDVKSVEEMGIYGINSAAAATCFVVQVERKKFQYPQNLDGVIDPQWVTVSELLGVWTRQGVFEMIEDWRLGRRSVYRLSCRPVSHKLSVDGRET